MVFEYRWLLIQVALQLDIFTVQDKLNVTLFIEMYSPIEQ